MEMWLKQIEIEKVQETALQEALNSVIRHNRQIQSEYETLFCAYEKLIKKFKHFNERDSNIKCGTGIDFEYVHLNHIKFINLDTSGWISYLFETGTLEVFEKRSKLKYLCARVQVSLI